MTEPMQKLARGAMHCEGAQKYVGEMPLSVFKKLPDKVQIKMKACLKSQEVDAEKIARSNMSQAEKTAADQAKVRKERDEEKAKKDNKPGK